MVGRVNLQPKVSTTEKYKIYFSDKVKLKPSSSHTEHLESVHITAELLVTRCVLHQSLEAKLHTGPRLHVDQSRSHKIRFKKSTEKLEPVKLGTVTISNSIHQ